MPSAAPNKARAGFISGAAVIDDGLAEHDLRRAAWTGPAAEWNGSLRVIDHNAQFVLLVEKHTVFNRLVQDRFHESHSCVLATGCGFPGTQFRKLLHEFHEQLNVPFYVLADNDPAGYEFFLLIGSGSGARRAGDETAIPSARYLGLRADDCVRLDLDKSVQIPLNDTDLAQLRRLQSKGRLASDPGWQHELDQMLRNGFKLEMETLCTVRYTFLADTYLPRQLDSGRFLPLSGLDGGEK